VQQHKINHAPRYTITQHKSVAAAAAAAAVVGDVGDVGLGNACLYVPWICSATAIAALVCAHVVYLDFSALVVSSCMVH